MVPDLSQPIKYNHSQGEIKCPFRLLHEYNELHECIKPLRRVHQLVTECGSDQSAGWAARPLRP